MEHVFLIRLAPVIRIITGQIVRFCVIARFVEQIKCAILQGNVYANRTIMETIVKFIATRPYVHLKIMDFVVALVVNATNIITANTAKPIVKMNRLAMEGEVVILLEHAIVLMSMSIFISILARIVKMNQFTWF